MSGKRGKIMTLEIDLSGLSPELRSPADELCRECGFSVSADGKKIIAKKGNVTSVSLKNDVYNVTYRRKNEFFRELTRLGELSEGDTVTEKGSFSMLCYMADASRNAVMNQKSLHRLIRYLAGMGYDSLMLYTEDTYKVPGYAYFGRMRGAYSAEELREIDDYADSFGIELIPCIQTLAHLSTAIRWPGLSSFRDTGDILLAGDERTYSFIRACLTFCRDTFRSRRINIGMDEAHMLGLGNYLKKHGYRPAPEIMTEHLSRVAEICADLGLEPMMWSDMFFRMAFGGQYRVREGEIPPEVAAKIPENVTPIYWDYYSLDRQIFDHMLDCHLKLDRPTVFAGGAWKWSGFAPHNAFSLYSTALQLDSCAERGVDSVIVTGWGDNGGEASQFSTLPTLLYFAERLYAGGEVRELSPEFTEMRSRHVFGESYADLMLFDLPNALPGTEVGKITHPVNPCKYLLFNDVLEGLYDRHMKDGVGKFYADAAKTLAAHAETGDFSHEFRTLAALCDLLSVKAELGIHITAAYLDGEKDELRRIAGEDIPAAVEKLDVFTRAFREQWFEENKPFGFSTQDVRLGGLRARLLAAAERIDAYLSGETENIPELEEPRLWADGRADDSDRTPYINCNGWSQNVSANIL